MIRCHGRLKGKTEKHCEEDSAVSEKRAKRSDSGKWWERLKKGDKETYERRHCGK